MTGLSVPAGIRARVRSVVRRSRRTGRHLVARGEAPLLALRNRRSPAPVVGDHPVTVSLTSYGDRLATVHLAIESIGRGSVKPRRLILWVEDPGFAADPPAELARLQARGLEVICTEGFGPHTKYYPYTATQGPHRDPLVTADDDIIYPRSWLAALTDSYAAHPDAVSCHWANRISVRDGRIQDYGEWSPSRSTESRRDQLALGVSGVLYPPRMLDLLAEAGTGFLDKSPTADDLWLHWVALRNNVPVRQVNHVPRHFPLVPGSQATSLLSTNVLSGRNNEWIRRLYSQEDVRALAGSDESRRSISQ